MSLAVLTKCPALVWCLKTTALALALAEIVLASTFCRVAAAELDLSKLPPPAEKKIDPVKQTDPRAHWAFRAPVHPVEPTLKNKKWPRNAIDKFVLARLEKEKLSPAPEADRVTLIRRLSLDLIGLPPSVKEVDEFVNDRSSDAYEKLVERLLDSPHYGERWGRHWLDLSRYANTNG